MRGITGPGTASRTVRALASLTGLLTVLVGPPVALARFGGWPLPHRWPTGAEWAALAEHPLTGTTLRDAVICLMWLLWAVVTALVARDIADRIRRRPALRRPRWRLAAPFHTVANSLIGTVLLGISAVTSRGVPTAAGPTSSGPAVPAASGPAAAAVAPLPAGRLTVLAADQHYTYTVHRGDTLWHIADAWLGDPNRWTEIYHLNREQYDRHGRMHHGDHIETGWVLVLPDNAMPPPSAAPSTPPVGSLPPSPPPAVATPATPAPIPPSAAQATGDTGTAPTGQPRADNRASAPVAAASERADGPEPAPGDLPRSSTHGVDLGEAGWVAVPLATAITALAALVWIQRRRRYRPQSPGSARSDLDLRPLPRSIAAIQKAREDLTSSEDLMDQGARDTHEATIVTAAALGAQGDQTVWLDDLPVLGVGLDGPGALAAARGVLAAALTAGGPWAAHHEASVVTTQTDLVTLLGPAAAHHYALDRLHAAATLEQALNHAEHELLRRARAAGDDVTGVPEPDEDEPRPPIVILATAPVGPVATRLAAILAVGSRLAIHGILLGDWESGTTWHVNADGTTATDGRRLSVLDTTSTTDILDTLAEARPDEALANDRDAPETDDAPSTPTSRPPLPQPRIGSDHASAARSQPPDVRTPRLRLTVLGRPAVHLIADDTATELRIRRSDGLQLLIHLAVTPDGATSDQLMAAVWPEVRPRYARGRFHTTISELRHHLGDALGADAITRTGDRYRLDPERVEVDLWRLTAAVQNAATAIDADRHAAALRRLVAAAGGPIADGHSWLWLAPYREEARRHVLDAHVALADTADDPQEALSHLQDAIRVDPYNEDLYQRAMHRYAAVGNSDGIRRTLRALAQRLSELELQPSPQIQRTAAELLAKLDARLRSREPTA